MGPVRRHLLLVGALLAFGGLGGCRAIAELVESDIPAGADGGGGGDAPVVDGRPGADADVSCDTWAFQPTHVDPCEIPGPVEPLVLTAGVWTFDTNSGALTDPSFNASFPASALIMQSGGPQIRVVSVTDVEIPSGAELRAIGRRPLVLVSWSDIDIGGTLSVASQAAEPGAGGDPDDCTGTAPTPGADFAEGAGGGGGGGFAEAGADGGYGRDMMAAPGTGGAAVGLPTVVRGGCAGANGGNSAGGAGGAGGGALQLTARMSITVTGVIHAGGGGGGGSGGLRSGGGGGGSGGLIDLEAPAVTISANGVLAANGGGGGGGSDNNPAGDGQDAQPSADPALGGEKEGMGDEGGPGGALGAPAGKGVDSSRGGGGGGGGVGYILVRSDDYSPDGAATISPAVDQR